MKPLSSFSMLYECAVSTTQSQQLGVHLWQKVAPLIPVDYSGLHLLYFCDL